MSVPKSNCSGCAGAKSRAAAVKSAGSAPAPKAAAPKQAADAWKNFAEKKRAEVKKPVAVPKAPAKQVETKQVAKPDRKLDTQAVFGPCSNEVPFCVTIEVPDCYHLFTPISGDTPPLFTLPAEFSQLATCHLTCDQVTETQLVTDVPVPNPCGGPDIVCNATVTLSKIYVRGYAQLIVGLAVITNSAADRQCGGIIDGGNTRFSYVSRTVQLPVNNLVCISCDGKETCDTLFPIIDGQRTFLNSLSCPVIDVKELAPCVDGACTVTPCGGNRLYQVSGTYILNSCQIGPFNINGTVSCQVSGELPTGRIVELRELDGTTIHSSTTVGISGAYSFSYTDNVQHYIYILSPSGATVLAILGPFNAQETQDIGDTAVDCTVV